VTGYWSEVIGARQNEESVMHSKPAKSKTLISVCTCSECLLNIIAVIGDLCGDERVTIVYANDGLSSVITPGIGM
jgi:hypothetical protein